MRVFDADAIASSLPYARLIDALDDAFRTESIVPQRVQYPIDVPGAQSGTLLLMPAWIGGQSIGVKIATVFPDNVLHGLATLHANYVLLDAGTGTFLALLDGTELTLRRTACASALASRYLSRRDSHTLLMVGTGKLAPHMIIAHANVRPISRVIVWGRRKSAAEALAEEMRDQAFEVDVALDLEGAVAQADIVSCATLAREPLIRGRWLRPGQHLDLVGAFTAQMREADTEAVTRAEVFVDTLAGAAGEAGEIVQAVESGNFELSDIEAELADLARGKHAGRSSVTAITLFKSVGTALEDLAAARLVVDETA